MGQLVGLGRSFLQAAQAWDARVRKEDVDEVLARAKVVLAKFPAPNIKVIQYLFSHLRKVRPSMPK
jgi:hypothetical protein